MPICWPFLMRGGCVFHQGTTLAFGSFISPSDRSNSSQIASRFLPVITIGDAAIRM